MGDSGHSAEAVAIPPAAAAHGWLSQHRSPANQRLASLPRALEKLKKPRLVGSCFAVLSVIHVCGLCGVYVFWIILREVLTEAQLLKFEANLGETEKS